MFDPGSISSNSALDGTTLNNGSSNHPANNKHNRNATISTAHDNTLIPCYKLMQAEDLIFNATPPSSADDHPFLPSGHSQLIDAMPPQDCDAEEPALDIHMSPLQTWPHPV